MTGLEATATPLWFGSAARPLFGWLHVPAGARARAGVLLCPPIGLEGRKAHFALRALAVRLAAAGVAALRFDYAGTGDSAGSLIPNPSCNTPAAAGTTLAPPASEAWIESVASAAELLRSAGAPAVGVAGMRLGATIACEAIARGVRADALALWDPCRSGRTFLREQRALLGLIAPNGDPRETHGSVELPGLVLDSETAGALLELDIPSTPPRPAPRLLVLLRPEREAGWAFTEWLSAGDAEVGEALGQSEHLDAAYPYQRIPYETIDSVASWLAASFGGADVPISVPDRPAAVVARDDLGRPIIEQALRIAPGLFAMETVPPTESPRPAPAGNDVQRGADASTAPVVVFINDGQEHHVGPARLWVDLARSWAADGVRSLRVDLSGIGDSDARPGRPDLLVYSPDALEDVGAAVRAASPGDPSRVVLIGICAGAYTAIEAGIAFGARGVYAVNPLFTFELPEVAAGGRPAPWRRARRAAPPAVRRLSRLHPRLPSAVWKAVTQVALDRSPPAAMQALVRNGVDVLIVCGDRESHSFERLLYWRFARRRLAATGRFRFRLARGLHHGLLVARERNEVAGALTTQVVGARDRRAVSKAAPVPQPPDPSRFEVLAGGK